MKKVIHGITVGTPMPRPDFNQTDPTKADYILNNPIPRVSVEDDGKFLRVQEGKWAAVDISYAEEDEY